MATKQRIPLAERFARCVNKDAPNGCWLWTASMNGNYGQISIGGHQGKPLLAHRASWEIAYGPIPNTMQVLHRCDNGRCVNPDHLFLGTQMDNIHDMMAKGRDGFRGERHGAAKLTEAQVREILTSTETGRSIYRRTGISWKTISDIRRRVSWRHVLP